MRMDFITLLIITLAVLAGGLLLAAIAAWFHPSDAPTARMRGTLRDAYEFLIRWRAVGRAVELVSLWMAHARPQTTRPGRPVPGRGAKIRRAGHSASGRDRVNTTVDIVRVQRAVLAATLAAHGDTMPTGVSSSISAAVDELTDPLSLPDYLPPTDPAAADPIAAVRAARETLRSAIGVADVAGGLACGRAVRDLGAALAAWRVPTPRPTPRSWKGWPAPSRRSPPGPTWTMRTYPARSGTLN